MAGRDEHRLTTNVRIVIVLRWAPPRCPSEHVENSFRQASMVKLRRRQRRWKDASQKYSLGHECDAPNAAEIKATWTIACCS